MLNAIKTASYFRGIYLANYKKPIDEMKLHKLLYLFLREGYVILDRQILDIKFEARLYGPVSPEIRAALKNNTLKTDHNYSEIAPYSDIVESVFNRYASKNSWSLSSLTHGEESWRKAREYYKTNGSSIMNNEDIRKDAGKARLRRYVLTSV